MNDEISITIRCFASARDMFGQKQFELAVPTGTSLLELQILLSEKYHLPLKNLEGMIFSRNQEFAQPEELIRDQDEIGIFPPVSGGSSDGQTITRITDQDISVDALSKEITDIRTGAAVVFTGFVRGETPGTKHPQTEKLEYEAYEPMAVKKMNEICAEMRNKWPFIFGIYMVQRVGDLLPGDIAVAIGVSCGHRGDGAFEAARYGIDRLKEVVPVWKKEVGPDGEEWVEGDFHPGA
jgi:MoaE-MoaD fusion protein